MTEILPNPLLDSKYKNFTLYLDRDTPFSGEVSNGFLSSAAYPDAEIGIIPGDAFVADLTNPVTAQPAWAAATLPSLISADHLITDGDLVPTTYRPDLVSRHGYLGNKDPSLIVTNLASVGSLQVGDVVGPPQSLLGDPDDKRGMIRIDSNKLWYCHTDYDVLNPSNNIWKWVDLIDAIPPSTSFVLRDGPIVNFPYGTPGDKKGDTVVLTNITSYDPIPDSNGDVFSSPSITIFYCMADYISTTDPVWTQISRPNIQAGGLRRRNVYPGATGSDIVEVTEYLGQGMYPVYKGNSNALFDMTQDSGKVNVTNGVNTQNYFLPAPNTDNPAEPFDSKEGFYFQAYNSKSILKTTSLPFSGNINGGASVPLYPGQFATIMTLGNEYIVANSKPPSYFEPIAFASSITLNCKYTTKFKIGPMTGIMTLENPIGIGDGETLQIILQQDASGFARTISYGSKFKWAGSTIIQPSVGANKVDLLTCVYSWDLGIYMCSMLKDIR